MLITHIRQLTPETLTAIFQHNGILEHGATVSEIRVQESHETTTGHVHFLRVSYRDYRSLKRAPHRIFVKITRPGLAFAEREALFYEMVAPEMQNQHSAGDLVFPVSYDTYYDEDKQQAHFLLEDLSDGFRPAADGQPPSKVHREKMMERLAFFHAFWWGHPDLKKFTPAYDDTALDNLVIRYQAAFEAFAPVMRNKLPFNQWALLEQIVTKLPPKRRETMIKGLDLTLVHRDTHPNNFLYSFNNVKLIDWQSWRTDHGLDDVAYLIACHLPEPVQRLETRSLLQKYYNTLQKANIQGYTWEDCQYDYLASLARCVGFLLVVWKAQTPDFTQGQRALKALDEMGGMKIFS